MKKTGNRDRQRAFRSRQIAAGFKHRTVYVKASSIEAGRAAAKRGEPCDPMTDPDPKGWVMGWLKEMEGNESDNP